MERDMATSQHLCVFIHARGLVLFTTPSSDIADVRSWRFQVSIDFPYGEYEMEYFWLRIRKSVGNPN